MHMMCRHLLRFSSVSSVPEAAGAALVPSDSAPDPIYMDGSEYVWPQKYRLPVVLDCLMSCRHHDLYLHVECSHRLAPSPRAASALC